MLRGALLWASLTAVGSAMAGPVSDSAVSVESEVSAPAEAEPLPLPPETKMIPLPEMELPRRPGGSPRAGLPASYEDILAAIDREAVRTGLPAEIAEAVTHTESRFNRNAIGADGEIGLMQVLPSTARMMGFSGSLAELADPETNIRYGVTYLAQAWRKAGGDLCTAVMKYRAGHGESRFSYLSVDYCLKVRARLMSRGFKVAGVVPAATFGSPAGGGSSARSCRGRCLFGSRGGPDLAALNSKLSQIAFRVTVMKVPMR